jgi:hypothetical protein
MGIIVEFPDGPTDIQTIADTFQGKVIPQQLEPLLNNKIQCPITRIDYFQMDTHKLFLIPVVDKF